MNDQIKLNEEMEWAQSLLNPEKINEQIKDLELATNRGYLDPLEAYVFMKKLSSQLDDIMKEVKELALKELNKYPENMLEKYGAKFSKTKGKANYSFKGVPGHAEAVAAKKKIEDDAKAAFKAREKGQQMFDDETGEILHPCGVTYSKDSFSISIIS